MTREEKRLQWIEDYSPWHDRQWLESLTYAEFVCWRNANVLGRPCLPI